MIGPPTPHSPLPFFSFHVWAVGWRACVLCRKCGRAFRFPISFPLLYYYDFFFSGASFTAPAAPFCRKCRPNGLCRMRNGDGGGFIYFISEESNIFEHFAIWIWWKKKDFPDDPRIEEEEKKLGQYFFLFLSLPPEVRFPMRLVLTRTQGARSRLLLCAFASLHLLSPHRNVFNRYVQSRVKGGGFMWGKEGSRI